MFQPPIFGHGNKNKPRITPPASKLVPVLEPKTTSKSFDPTQPISQKNNNVPITKAQKEAQWQYRSGIYQQAAAGDPNSIATLTSQGQMWRTTSYGGAGMRLGSTAYLDPQILISIQINYDWFLYLQQLMLSNPPFRRLQENELLSAIKSQLETPLQNYLFNLIDMLVPSDSGRLRNNIKISLREHGQINSLNPFFLVVDAGKLSYASPVNEMPDLWLKHYGQSHKGGLSNRTGRTVKQKPHGLYDPLAERHWFQKIVNGGRTYTEVLWQRLRQGLFTSIFTPVVQALNKPVANQPPQQYYTLDMIIDGLFTWEVPAQMVI